MSGERIEKGLSNLAYQIEIRFCRRATVEQARAFLWELSQPVLDGDKERQVVYANQLKQREIGPLFFRRHSGCYVPHTIETEEGSRSVPSLTWQEAFEIFAEELGCDLEAEGRLHASFRKRKPIGREESGVIYSPEAILFREETEIPTNRADISMLRIKEWDTSQEGNPLTLLGFEIRNAGAERKWHREQGKEGEHDGDYFGRTW